MTRRMGWIIGLSFAANLIALMVNAIILGLTLKPYHPLGDYPVQTVNSRVPRVPGPAVYLGDPVSITGTKCIIAKNPVPVRGVSTLASRDDRQPPIILVKPGTGLPQIRQPGCATNTFVNAWVEGLTVGVWRFEGADTVTDGNKTQIKTFWSQDFQVVARETK
jgi:hypothetical protein